MSAVTAPADEPDPIWKQMWKREGIRYLGPDGKGNFDAMERWRHAFLNGYEAGLLRGLELAKLEEEDV